MALKDLSIEAMLAVSDHILNPPANRPQLQNKDELYSGLLVLNRAHEHLLQVNKTEGETREKIAQITIELAELDAEHDRCSRAIYRILSASADIALDPKEAAKYLSVMDVLHPNGLSVNQLSYAEQSGNTMRVARRVTPELRRLLATINIVGQSLDVVLDRWLTAGAKMGELQAERDMLNTDEDPNRVTAGIIMGARNQWIRAVHAFVAALDSTDFSEAEKTTILAHLRAADAQAVARRNKVDEQVDEEVVVEEVVVEEGTDGAGTSENYANGAVPEKVTDA